MKKGKVNPLLCPGCDRKVSKKGYCDNCYKELKINKKYKGRI